MRRWPIDSWEEFEPPKRRSVSVSPLDFLGAFQIRVADFVVESWCAFALPAGVPAAINERASAAFQAAAANPSVQGRFLRGGARAVGSAPDGV